MTSAITATGLRKSFGGKIVLDGIDLLTGEENLLRSTPGRSGPPPCSGPIAISILSYPAAGNGPSSASPAGCASRTARFPHTASPACGDASPTHDGGTTRPDFRTRTPGPISVPLELGTGDVRIAATGLRRLASAIERVGGEDTGSEGASG